MSKTQTQMGSDLTTLANRIDSLKNRLKEEAEIYRRNHPEAAN